jgi:cytochrome c oxidase subunit 3
MSTKAQHYFVPAPSHWMIFGSVALLCMALGAASWFNGAGMGAWLLLAGFATLVFMMVKWFGDVIGESESGKYNKWEDTSFRWGMIWFIFSEVMFFAAFFGALFYARQLSVPWLGDLDSKLLWPDFSAVWPTAGPNFKETFTPMSAWGIPAINTALLLTSGVTLTFAHFALIKNSRSKLILWMFATVALGALFLSLQIYEYSHAYAELNLKLTTGIYGSTFFMLTGFHGFHVTVGAIMLSVITFRCIAGHFKPEHHFAFEAVAWYWHFVDVVWLLLFVVVYWL